MVSTPRQRPAPGPLGNRWVLGSRPRTLPASGVPVIVGTAAASAAGHVIWWRAAAALIVALAIQVATNYANDYSDGIRGTDDTRVGPVRLVASGMASAGAVKRAAIGAFAVAGVAGVALAAAAGWWLLAVGAACFAAGWFYTGGPRPYGYAGLGEVFVFVFFGLVATVGSAYVSLERVTALAVVVAVPVGLLSVALLVVNNLRDVAGDEMSGKRTLAVRLGAPTTRLFYVACLAGAYVFVVVAALVGGSAWILLPVLSLPVAVAPARRVLAGAAGRDLIEVLGATGRLVLVLGALLAAGLAV
ncbi:1,4-dihydroxy-2-naphthoate polyprenyltransferase [Acidiferrimicrobium sp. IK]|uniref:1,4-dihydroxy-2-naphthoate polyprenyltransferase n=1 Tax=Acidiferrimicrobium sp. IK TaxID=2871700 RepID=UPI0021CB693E|nr:1,4-dihydroxy-2-naphthoate polyprenyltransferase [Acidiferrimicrobium sp. IK]MCU4183646.1 1,4-dihydroxy-2-naphthoate polyprenyltransferase [Acidiferrimicrobium sp. IK]